MTEQPRPDELATLRAEFAAFRTAQEAEIARLKRRRRLPRRLLPVILATLLVALIPLATLAANPFTDLNPGSPHNGDIDAIFNAGVTTGCSPTEYCPTRNVTREEVASFLARTAGLGGNPPIVNALTAQSAVSAQTATSATSATSAGNANTVGGYAPSGLVRVAGDGNANLFTNGTYDPGQAVTIIAPAAGFVLITASAVPHYAGGQNCPCRALMQIVDTVNDARAPLVITTLATNTADAQLVSTWAFPVAAGQQTFRLEVDDEYSGSSITYFNQSITALYVPFGYDGGTTLAP